MKQKEDLQKKHNALMEQLGPLEDVFHKIQKRTGAMTFTADGIAALFIQQRDSHKSLEGYYTDLGSRLAELQEWNAQDRGISIVSILFHFLFQFSFILFFSV